MECIKVNGRRDNTKSTLKSKDRVCYIEYTKYSTDVCGYVRLRGSLGGTRQMRFNGAATQEDIIELARSNFFKSTASRKPWKRVTI